MLMCAGGASQSRPSLRAQCRHAGLLGPSACIRARSTASSSVVRNSRRDEVAARKPGVLSRARSNASIARSRRSCSSRSACAASIAAAVSAPACRSTDAGLNSQLLFSTCFSTASRSMPGHHPWDMLDRSISIAGMPIPTSLASFSGSSRTKWVTATSTKSLVPRPVATMSGTTRPSRTSEVTSSNDIWCRAIDRSELCSLPEESSACALSMSAGSINQRSFSRISFAARCNAVSTPWAHSEPDS